MRLFGKFWKTWVQLETGVSDEFVGRKA